LTGKFNQVGGFEKRAEWWNGGVIERGVAGGIAEKLLGGLGRGTDTVGALDEATHHLSEFDIEIFKESFFDEAAAQEAFQFSDGTLGG
jgi:hypothetical protein